MKKVDFVISKKLKIIILLFLIFSAVSYLNIFTELRENFTAYLKIIWWAVILGFLLGGIIDYFVPDEFIVKYLASTKKSVFIAVFLGFLLSACSHGILAISIQLYKKGASVASTIAFLLASPWANLPITILLFSFFKEKAFYFILAAISIAIITGHIFLLLEKFNLVEKSKNLHLKNKQANWKNIKQFNLKRSVKGITKSSFSLMNMVLGWILIGIMLATIIGTFVPQHFFMKYLGTGFLGLFLTLFFATIIEVCSEGTSPIAFEIFSKTGLYGNPFVFLMAGVATDYTEIGLLWQNIGKKTAMWLIIVTVPQVILLGYLFNILL